MYNKIVCASIALVSLLLASGAAQSQARPATLKLCMVDTEVHPWIFADGEGLAKIFMQDVMKRVNVAGAIERMPGRRCFLDTQRGEQDGTFGSYQPERGAFPMAADQPDVKRRMGQLSYSMFKLKGSNISFDGKTISGLTLPVGVPQGTSVGDIFKQMNLAVDDSTRVPEQVLKKVLLGRVGVAVLMTESGEKLMNSPEFAGKLERVDPPLVSRAYYLILSKKFVTSYPEFAQQMWDAVAVVRESAAFRKKADELH